MAAARIQIPYANLGRTIGMRSTERLVEDIVEGNQDWIGSRGAAAESEFEDDADADSEDVSEAGMAAMRTAESQLETAVIDALYAAFARAGETLHFNVVDDAKLRCFFLTPSKDWKDTAAQWVELLEGAGGFEREFGRKSAVAQFLALGPYTPIQAVERHLSTLGMFDAVYGGLDRAYSSNLAANLRNL